MKSNRYPTTFQANVIPLSDIKLLIKAKSGGIALKRKEIRCFKEIKGSSRTVNTRGWTLSQGFNVQS